MVKCKQCNQEMKDCGFLHYNRRFECYNCNLRFVPFWERNWFSVNFLGYPKWSKI